MQGSGHGWRLKPRLNGLVAAKPAFAGCGQAMVVAVEYDPGFEKPGHALMA